MKTNKAEFNKLLERALALLSNRTVLVGLLLGAVVLLALPVGAAKKPEIQPDTGIYPPAFSLEEQEERIREALERIDGVGEVDVRLSLLGTPSRELAMEDREALVISSGGGSQSAVELRYLYPEYRGAVIICEGGSQSRVRLDVTQAVASLTGLGSDKITVIKMK